MRTELSAMLREWWWRVNRFDLAPVNALDVFILTGAGPVYTCKFCAGSTVDPDVALGCVRGHINV